MPLLLKRSYNMPKNIVKRGNIWYFTATVKGKRVAISLHTEDFRVAVMEAKKIKASLKQARNLAWEKNFNTMDVRSQLKNGFLKRSLMGGVAQAAIQNMNELPLIQGTAVYVLLYQGQIVYAGQTDNLYYRISQHLKKLVFNAVYYSVVDPVKASQIEREMIQTYSPKYNTNFNR